VYSTYSGQTNTAFFESTGVAYEKTTRKEISPDFVKEYIQEIVDNEDLKKELAEAFNDPDIDVEKPPTTLAIRNRTNLKYAPIMTSGNISTIKGRAKSKKTYFLSIVAASLVNNTEIFQDIIPSLPDGKRQVLFFDTEQSKFHSSRLAKRISKMANCDTSHFGSFSLRGKDGKRIIQLISYACELYQNVGTIIIDQIADTVTSLNEEKEAVQVVRFLENLTAEKDIHVIVVVHENKQNNFAQGWLGTQLMKKSETVIEVKKNDMFPNVSKVIPAFTRDIEFDEISFRINDFGYPEVLDSNEHEQVFEEI
jgi:hypothetical protein